MTDDETPAAARLVRDFVNTYEPQTGVETLDSGEALRSWLARHQLLPEGATGAEPGDLRAALVVREGLRDVLLAHAGHDPDPAKVAALNSSLERLPLRAALDPSGYHLVSTQADLVGQALGRLLDAIRQSTEDGTWPRLKVCARDSCRWAYYDASRNQVRRWCSMAGCGNYVKMRRASVARKTRTQRADQPASTSGRGGQDPSRPRR